MEESTDKKKHNPGTKGTDAMNKRTAEEKAAHRQAVYDACDDMVARGMNYTERFKALAKQFSVSEQQGKTYCSWYKEDRKRLREEMVAETREDVITQLDYLYKEAILRGNHKEALGIIETKIKLTGISAPKVTVNTNINAEVSGTSGFDAKKLSTEQLKALHQKNQEMRMLMGLNPEPITIEIESEGAE